MYDTTQNEYIYAMNSYASLISLTYVTRVYPYLNNANN